MTQDAIAQHTFQGGNAEEDKDIAPADGQFTETIEEVTSNEVAEDAGKTRSAEVMEDMLPTSITQESIPAEVTQNTVPIEVSEVVKAEIPQEATLNDVGERIEVTSVVQEEAKPAEEAAPEATGVAPVEVPEEVTGSKDVQETMTTEVVQVCAPISSLRWNITRRLTAGIAANSN